MPKNMTVKMHEVATAVQTLYKVTGYPVQQDEVAKALDVSTTTAQKYILHAINARLVHDLETRAYMPARLVPYKAIQAAFPVRKRNSTAAHFHKKKEPSDARLGWLF